MHHPAFGVSASEADVYCPDHSLTYPVHPEAIWALTYTPQHLISGSSDGHLRIFDPSALAEPLYDIPSHPLAITSLSSTSDGKYALAASLDGTVVLVDVRNGTVVGKVETGREKAAEGENGGCFLLQTSCPSRSQLSGIKLDTCQSGPYEVSVLTRYRAGRILISDTSTR